MDEGDENEDMEIRRLNIRWNNKEEILLAEYSLGSSTRRTRISEKTNGIKSIGIRFLKISTTEQQANRKSGENEADLIETVNTVYLERVGKKFVYPHVWKILKDYPKWDAAEPIDGDNLQEVFGPDKRERPAGKQPYEAQREKDLAIKKCEEMRFLMIDTSNLPPHKRAFIERKQAEIMRKYQDAGADD
ncbi:hypothetical protein Tco_0888746 [Tanacetum coccineum]